MENKTLSIREAAKQLKYTTKYVRDLLYEGRLSGAKKQGPRHQWQIPVATIEAHRQRRAANQ